MTQHYKDNQNNLYGYKPDGIEVTPITMDEVHAIIEANKPAPTKDELKQQAKSEYDQAIKLLVNDAPYSEIASWDKQEQEARALLADTTASTPFIDKLVVARSLGETREELANKIVAHADVYAIGAAKLLGEYQKKVKEIEAMV